MFRTNSAHELIVNRVLKSVQITVYRSVLVRYSDAGLRRKFQLALEDLRVHGPPGVSRFPGPSHVRPQWICDVWLRQHIGLSQLAPLFAVRRIDGRLLASLAIYKRTGRTNPASALTNRNSRTQLTISSPTELIVHPNPGSSLPGTPLPLNGPRMQSGENKTASDRSSGVAWRGASRKEFHRILLGLSRDNSAVNRKGSMQSTGRDRAVAAV
ncbi:unnamed protein product [Echinostoma caproni]|uniref:DUF4817 domain-containing protein n=1 Tax=Echinostoma caproni TaxID=27848 RepID=A0A183ANM9_9TREM|nr:unnamed protein product [Echinostoma caproni]